MSITPIPLTMKMEVLEQHGWNCLCCGRPTHRYPDAKVRPDTLSFDHVISEYHGGPTTVDNLQVLCMACNLHKGVDTIDLRKAAHQYQVALAETKAWSQAQGPFVKDSNGTIVGGGGIYVPALLGRFVWIVPSLRNNTQSEWSTDERRARQYFYGQQRTRDHIDEEDTWSMRWPQFKREVRNMPPCPVRERMHLAS
jgi:HNH endonuclease